MPVGTKALLSGSTSGRGVLIAATGTPGTTIHTATAGAVNFDEIWIWGTNSTATDRLLSIEFGGVTSPGDLIEDTIVSDDNSILMVPGFLLNGGLLVRGFASAANAVSCFGFVNQYRTT